jgi:hypothetical protein
LNNLSGGAIDKIEKQPLNSENYEDIVKIPEIYVSKYIPVVVTLGIYQFIFIVFCILLLKTGYIICLLFLLNGYKK